MKRQEAERIITEYLKPIYGFTLKRCKSLQDAEDLSQEIVTKAFRTLLIRDDIAEILCDNTTDPVTDLVMRETTDKLQREIAYLSKLQRKIVIAYYYENKKQNEIAEEIGIPAGTVKWHLFEAKKDLKKGMESMRTSSELKFNPIKFAVCGTNGSVGTKGDNGNFFRNALPQNIEYVTWKEPKTINEIADALGVSPVYVESEVEYLEEYGFLTKHGDKYLCNILIDETTSELNQLHDEMYEKAAKIFANELYDRLLDSDIWDNPNIVGERTEELDKNFFMWTLLPYITAMSGETLMDTSISFEQAATLRPDGGENICYASVLNSEVTPPKYFDSMQKWAGPCWNGKEELVLWQIDSEWSEKRVDDTYQSDIWRVLTLLNHEIHGTKLRKDEYAYLAERGYIKIVDVPGEESKVEWQCVYIDGKEAKKSLISIGDKIREKYKDEFEKLRKRYMNAVLKSTPKHLHTMQKYSLQFLFFADGWFILHCLKELVNNGKLKAPTEAQKKALTTIIIHED